MEEKEFPDGYPQLTPIIGTEKILAARASDGEMFWILLSDISVIETGASIRSKLGITTLSGNNTGDQDLSNLVVKDGTKVLSDVNFSQLKDEKLAGISAGATANDTDVNLKNRANHTGAQAATTITEDTTHRFVTDAEKISWNAGSGSGPTSTDGLPEGSTNKYWTLARTVGALLTGFVGGSTHVAVAATDTLMQALQKISGSIAAANTAIAGKEATIVAGTTSQYWRGDKSWQTFAAAAIGSVITGFVTTTSTVVTAADTILVALGKLQAQISLRATIAPVLGTSTALTFAVESIQGSVGTPLTGNITASTTGAVVGVVVHIVHQNATAPTYDSKFKKGFGTYTTGVINHIYCEYMSATHIVVNTVQITA